MAKGFHHKQSKRVLAKRRYKIEKKVKDHHRKLRKESKKSTLKKRKPKDPGIPNSLPFKQEVIGELRSAKQREINHRKTIKDEMKKLVKSGKEDEFYKKNGISRPEDRFNMLKKQILASAVKKQDSMMVDEESSPGNSKKSAISNLKHYHKEFQKVIEESDVLIEVLDARDPLGTRCPEVEEALIKAGPKKRLILLLNKVDLIPRENLDAWLRYLRQEFPSLAFKANTQRQRNLSRNRKGVFEARQSSLKTSKGFGAQELLSLLKNYCRNLGIKQAITVGVVGLPNVGKSSVINTLKFSRACSTGAVPGVTKVTQRVILDKNIHLIDCPGIVYGNVQKSGDSGVLALRNSVLFEQIDNPLEPIKAILARIEKEKLLTIYKIPDFDDPSDFLDKMAKRFGLLKKGGNLDPDGAAKKVLHDWNIGKLPYVTYPPEVHEMPSHISAEIVSKMSAGFSLDNLGEEMEEDQEEALDEGEEEQEESGEDEDESGEDQDGEEMDQSESDNE
ncbi:uncharacterized protein LOC141853304 [Brevipalpus obovatus]|uniref:uncharacterized protein LOC141853304 n=1 Tax=Brevipalpus obovatus TaxID=246614 RepID=UPI003D9EE329